VTGASSGIGRAIALALASAGAGTDGSTNGAASRILVHYRQNESGAEQTAQMIRQLGGHPVLFSADLSNPNDVTRLVQHAVQTLGPIQTWVNNAGADMLTGQAKDWDFETKLRRLFDVDVIGTISLSRQVAARLRDQASEKPPSMVFIGWDQADQGMEGDAGQLFAPVKAAVAAFATSLAQDFADQVRVNTVAPGWIQTSWGTSTSEYWDQRAKQQALMGRWGTPEDIARAVLYVADPDNSFLQGQTITVNGGWNRRFDR
tara:strand:+ start:638595 stop:639374 length:780 start_codon:yes stop_codon:yes gene_type:complete